MVNSNLKRVFYFTDSVNVELTLIYYGFCYIQQYNKTNFNIKKKFRKYDVKIKCSLLVILILKLNWMRISKVDSFLTPQ